jgi:ankyrin repeat protein
VNPSIPPRISGKVLARKKDSAEERALKKLKQGITDPGEFEMVLRKASLRGWTSVIKEAIRRGFDASAPLPSGDSLLNWAVGRGEQLSVLRILLDAGADPNAEGVMAGCSAESLPLLLQAGGCVDGNPDDFNPLFAAIRRSSQAKALAMIAAGASVNIRNERSMTALMLAAQLGCIKTFFAMLDAGADLYAADDTGRSLIRYAFETVANGSHETTIAGRRAAKTILRRMKGMLPAQPEDDILMDICTDDVRALRARLDNGLNPDTLLPGSIGILGIPREVFFDRLKAGTDLTAQLTSGHFVPKLSELDSLAVGATLLMWAVAAQAAKCVKLLLERGADPNRPDGNGMSAAAFCIRAVTSSQIKRVMGTGGVLFREDLRGRKFVPTIGPFAAGENT